MIERLVTVQYIYQTVEVEMTPMPGVRKQPSDLFIIVRLHYVPLAGQMSVSLVGRDSL